MKGFKHINLIILLGLFILFGCSAKEKNDVDADIDSGNSTQQSANPKIQSMDPATANPGDTVLIAGSNFGSKLLAVAVLFTDEKAKVISVTDKKIKVVVPPAGEKDWSNVVVMIFGKASNSYLFTYNVVKPKIDSLSINAAAAGANIEILGSGFGDKKANITVIFGDDPVSATSVEDKSIKVDVPPYSGKKSVVVQVTVKSYKSNEVAFYYKGVAYTNPVSNTSLPDPTVIRSKDGWFYLYATEDTPGMPIMRSNDLTNWEWTGLTVFNQDTRPTWLSGGGLWAPDINYIDNKYVLYYALSKWGEEHANGLGVATADKLDGPFTDNGKLFTSDEIGVQNSIDPDLFVAEDSRKYLFWGSFRGIYMIEMNSDGLSIKSGAKKRQVANDRFEGLHIYKRGNYYYLFASIGSCCDGLNSTYQLVVGRSTSLTGPYVNKIGTSMMNGGYTVIVSGNSTFKGTGHCSQIVKDDDGNDWILFHGYDTRITEHTGWRMLLLERLYWDDGGWPYVGNNGTPSIIEPGPFFKNN